VTRRAGRVCAALGLAGLAVGACQVNRDRPGPPRIALTLDQDSVHSPDTLTGSLRADDPEGIDSIWLSVDSAPPVGEDGLLQQTFLATFRAGIRSGHVLGDRVSVRFWARDISGYTGGLDTFVVVRGP
jgi:hypothetical protein